MKTLEEQTASPQFTLKTGLYEAIENHINIAVLHGLAGALAGVSSDAFKDVNAKLILSKNNLKETIERLEEMLCKKV